MKSKYRVLSVLLMLCLLLGLVPAVGGVTAKAATTITELKLTTLLVPVVGETAPGSPVTLTGKHVKQVGTAEWRRKSGGGSLVSGTFQSGEEYYVRFVLRPESGYTFPSQLSDIKELVLSSELTGTNTNYVDAAYCKIEDGELTIESKYILARNPAKITRIGVSGYKQPNPGEGPQSVSSLGVITNAKYTITDICFYNVTNHCSWSAALNEGETYYPYFTLTANYGFYFPNQAAEDFEVYSINGVPGMVDGGSGYAGSGGKTYTLYGNNFTCHDQSLVDSILMQGFSDPIVGEEAPEKFFNMNGAQHAHMDYSKTEWREQGASSSTVVTSFREGKRYFVRFVLVPNSGYHFPASISDFTKLSLTRANETENLLDLPNCRVEGGKLYLETKYMDVKPAKQINSISINGYTQPMPGDSPQAAGDLTVAGSSYYTIEDVKYYNATEYRYVTTFTEGKEYYTEIYLKAKYGYFFPNQHAGDFTICRINGGTDLVDLSHGSAMEEGKSYVLYTENYICHDPKCITSVDLTGFVDPKVGESPLANFFSTTGQHVALVSAEWIEEGSSSFSTFKDGKRYYVRFTLQPTSGYHFPDSVTAFTSLSLTRTGMPETNLLDPGKEKLQGGKLTLETLWISAKAATAINDIAVTGYEWPLVGGTPLSAGQLSVPSNAPYRIEQLEYKCTSYSDPASTFEAGKRYYAKIYLRANYGYTFENQWANQYNSCTINGGTAMLDEHYGFTQEGGKVYVLSTATAEAKSTITSVNVNGLVQPLIGEHPQEVTVSSSAPYTIKEAYWYNDTNDRRMTTADVFEAGKRYYLRVALEPKSSYTFPKSFSALSSATFDGSTSQVDTEASRIEDGNLILFSIDYDLPKLITDVDLIGFVRPSAGQTPATVAVPSGAHYKISSQSWYNRNDGEYMSSSSTFDANKKYCLEIVLEPLSGYAFPSEFSELASCTFNGSTYEVDSEFCYVSSYGSLTVYSVDYDLCLQPGDVNSDHRVNNRDVLALFRSVGHQPVTVRPDALDVNDSGSVNVYDAEYLFRYVSGENVTIY